MELYQCLAAHYDALMSDCDYASWADFFMKLTANDNVQSVLDLGCGTGTLTCLLAERGYETIGVDASADMLSAAYGRDLPESAIAPLWLMQRMEDLDLYGTVDACVCSMDGLNHLPDLAAVRIALQRVHLFLNPGGVLLFDILSPAHFATIDGRSFVSQGDSCFVSWTCSSSDIDCVYDFTVFEKEGRHWVRQTCTNREIVLEPQWLCESLTSLGFTVSLYGDCAMRPPQPDESRLFIAAHKQL